MQCSVHVPTSYIRRHRDKLLPNWSCAIESLLIVLQRSACNLATRSQATEAQKHHLRKNFLQFGGAITAQLQQAGYMADLFDPKTGYPLLSTPGRCQLDDVAVVASCLGYATAEVEECAVILHPEWGSAVYPSIVVSAAQSEIVARVVHSVISGGLVGSDSACRSLSEYHHSFIGCGSLIQ